MPFTLLHPSASPPSCDPPWSRPCTAGSWPVSGCSPTARVSLPGWTAHARSCLARASKPRWPDGGAWSAAGPQTGSWPPARGSETRNRLAQRACCSRCAPPGVPALATHSVWFWLPFQQAGLVLSPSRTVRERKDGQGPRRWTQGEHGGGRWAASVCRDICWENKQ